MSFRLDKDAVAALYNNLEITASPDRYPDDDVMEWVNEYLYAAYFMSINPLAGIRKVLPQYKWVYHQLNSYQAARSVTKQSDFIWCINAFGAAPDDKIELITATLIKVRKSLKCFYAGQKKASQGDDLTWEIKLAQDCGGEPMFSVVTNR